MIFLVSDEKTHAKKEMLRAKVIYREFMFGFDLYIFLFFFLGMCGEEGGY